jgi:transcriptional regulator with XRE-family HTH domain
MRQVGADGLQQRIAAVRKKPGLSQRPFAARIGVSPNAVLQAAGPRRLTDEQAPGRLVAVNAEAYGRTRGARTRPRSGERWVPAARSRGRREGRTYRSGRLRRREAPEVPELARHQEKAVGPQLLVAGRTGLGKPAVHVDGAAVEAAVCRPADRLPAFRADQVRADVRHIRV